MWKKKKITVLNSEKLLIKTMELGIYYLDVRKVLNSQVYKCKIKQINLPITGTT